MYRCAVLVFAVACGASALCAQTAAPAQGYGVAQMTSQAAVERMTAANSCPVSVRARQGSAAFERQVKDGTAKEPGQMLHVAIADRKARQVVSASVAVRGYYGKAGMMEVGTSRNRPNAARTMDVSFAGKDGSTEVWVPSLTGVKSIEVNSVTYADGSTWMVAGGSFCSAPVDGLMLISGR
jgi:hypothetical protein